MAAICSSLFPTYLQNNVNQRCHNEKTLLALVVQKVDNAIHRINHYPDDSVVCFVNTYPLEWIAIQPMNNWGLLVKDYFQSILPTLESLFVFLVLFHAILIRSKFKVSKELHYGCKAVKALCFILSHISLDETTS